MKIEFEQETNLFMFLPLVAWISEEDAQGLYIGWLVWVLKIIKDENLADIQTDER